MTTQWGSRARRIAGALVAAAALPCFANGSERGFFEHASASESDARRSVAVLPFADMSPERDQDYFCEGIAEEILNALTRLEDLRVASRMSSFRFKDSSMDSREIGDRLGVNTLVEGSVRKAGSRLRITAQLVDVAGGFELWSERYDRELRDVFAIQDEIAASVASALKGALSPRERRAIKQVATADVRAYEQYLRGRKFFNQSHQGPHQVKPDVVAFQA